MATAALAPGLSDISKLVQVKTSEREKGERERGKEREMVHVHALLLQANNQ